MEGPKDFAISGRHCFGPSGLVARLMPGYEYRPEQEKMMDVVASAIAHDDILLVEAGTGVGKTLAYLIPAVISKRKVIVATGTKALMEQIRSKDVPFVVECLGITPRVAVIKGRANYLCHLRLRQAFEVMATAYTPEEWRFLLRLRRWAKVTQTGDIMEVTDIPEGHEVFRRVVSTVEGCPGRACPDVRRCFLFRARAEALAADLIITNHHLFFSDLAMREEAQTRILPEDAIVIFDEAHSLEDVATQHLGVHVRSQVIADLANDALALCARTDPPSSRHLASIASGLSERFFALAAKLAGPDGKASFNPEVVPSIWHDLDSDLEVLAEEAFRLADEVGLSKDLSSRARAIRSSLQTVLGDTDSQYVRVAEVDRHSATLSALPVEVAPYLRERLFLTARPVILVSATLSVDGSTAFLRSRLGIPEEASEIILTSPFNFEEQVLLYLPEGMGDPNEEGFFEAFSKEALEVLEATSGRAFLLFTSHSGLRRAYDLMKTGLKWPAFVQGEAPRDELLRRFRHTEGAVLFGTYTFWEGVDVVGPALSCVIIDRLPFDPPDDPMLMARRRRIEEAGGNPFLDYQLPLAVIRLRQGFGRLIRSRSDRGVVAIMDGRIRSKSYGKVFLRSLPPTRVTGSREELLAWCKEALKG